MNRKAYVVFRCLRAGRSQEAAPPVKAWPEQRKECSPGWMTITWQSSDEWVVTGGSASGESLPTTRERVLSGLDDHDLQRCPRTCKLCWQRAAPSAQLTHGRQLHIVERRVAETDPNSFGRTPVAGGGGHSQSAMCTLCAMCGVRNEDASRKEQ